MAEEKKVKKAAPRKKKETKKVVEKQPRTFVIGDIHGAYKALLDVFKKSEFDYEKDTLISIGDVVDGYPDSKEVVEELLKVKNLIAIRGNHDLWFKDYIEGGEAMDIWVTQGGRVTLKSYGNQPIPDSHKDFFINKQVDYLVDDEKRLFVHAGAYPFFSEGQSLDDILFDKYGRKGYAATDGFYRECHWTRELDQMAVRYSTMNIANFKEKFKDSDTVKRCILFNESFKEIFVGHTPKKDVFNFGCYWNVDTDAGWGGPLTMLEINTKEKFQSEPSRKLYPNHQVRG